MKIASIIWVSAVLLSLAGATDANTYSYKSDFLPIFGRQPPTNRWIWYTAVGVRNSQPPVIYIAERRFNTKVPEALVVLSRSRYELMAAVTIHRVSLPQCPTDLPFPVPSYSLKIAQRSGSHVMSCVLPRVSACHYLVEVMSLSGMNWTSEELRPFESLRLNNGCGDHYNSGESRLIR